MALNLLRDCKDIKGEEEKKEGCVKHRKDHQKFTFVLNNSHYMFKN